MDLVNQEHEDSFERLNIKDQNIVDEANGLMPPSDREINLEENKKSSDGVADANSVREPVQKGSKVIQVMQKLEIEIEDQRLFSERRNPLNDSSIVLQSSARQNDDNDPVNLIIGTAKSHKDKQEEE